jgi:hypothetical protein
MGRTVRTFRLSIDHEEARWKGFKRTLRPAQREYIDRLFDNARQYADAGTMIATPRTTEVVFISTIIELLKYCDELTERVSRLEKLAGENQR